MFERNCFTDYFTYPKSPRGCILDSPPVVVQNWAALHLRSTVSSCALSALNLYLRGHRLRALNRQRRADSEELLGMYTAIDG
jgi:hypothetical protein